jgi:hypothetical protein
MTVHRKVALCVVGDLVAMVLIAALVPWLFVKLALMFVVGADLYLGLIKYTTMWGQD